MNKKCNRKSLSRMLLILFVLSGIFIIISTIASFHFIGDNPFKETFRSNVKIYANLLVDSFQEGTLEKYALENADLRIEMVAESDLSIYEEEQFPRMKFIELEDKVALGHSRFQYVVRVIRDEGVYFVIANENVNRRKSISLIVIVMLILLTLFFVHKRVKKYITPLDAIKESAIRYGEGDLDHSFEPSGAKEFQEVGASINDMRSKIKAMLDSKRTLLLSIGHELKTPLTRNKIDAEMIKDEKRRVSMLEDIKEMETIIDTLLESERVKEHKVLQIKEVNLESLLSDFDDIELNVKGELPPVKVDTIKIQLALKNIIQNAQKYKTNSVKVNVSFEDVVEISVIDDGPGVNDDDLSKLTEPFYRPDNSRSREDGGVGLGLYIAKEIVNSHGGKIHIKNRADCTGLEVTIRLEV